MISNRVEPLSCGYPLGPTQTVLIEEVSLFQGWMCLVLYAVPALTLMSVFQGCSQGGVPLYSLGGAHSIYYWNGNDSHILELRLLSQLQSLAVTANDRLCRRLGQPQMELVVCHEGYHVCKDVWD